MAKETFMEVRAFADKVIVVAESPVPLVLQGYKVFKAFKVYRDPRDNLVCLEEVAEKEKKVCIRFFTKNSNSVADPAESN